MNSGDYRIAFSRKAKRQLSEVLPPVVAAAAIELNYGGIASNPQRSGRALRAPLEGIHKANRGTYRILYEIYEESHSLQIINNEHRADVYKRH